jgi:hypothetical protein
MLARITTSSAQSTATRRRVAKFIERGFSSRSDTRGDPMDWCWIKLFPSGIFFIEVA